MRLKIELKCNIKDRLDINRNCVLKEGFRPNIEIDNTCYISFIEEIKESDALYCNLIVIFDSEYAVKKYDEIFKKGKNLYIKEGSKTLANCVILNIFKI